MAFNHAVAKPHSRTGLSRLLLSHQIPFKQNALLQSILFGFIVFWICMAIHPKSWKDWAVENTLLVLYMIVMAFMYRTFRHSNLAYILIAIFLAMHAYAAHFTYQHTPIDEWMKQAFHIKRGFYDRVVHFAYGLMISFSIRESVLYFFKL